MVTFLYRLNFTMLMKYTGANYQFYFNRVVRSSAGVRYPSSLSSIVRQLSRKLTSPALLSPLPYEDGGIYNLQGSVNGSNFGKIARGKHESPALPHPFNGLWLNFTRGCFANTRCSERKTSTCLIRCRLFADTFHRSENHRQSSENANFVNSVEPRATIETLNHFQRPMLDEI